MVLGFGAGLAKSEGGVSEDAGRGKVSLRNGPGSVAKEPTVSAGMPRAPPAEAAARKISAGDKASEMPIMAVDGMVR